MRTNSYLCNPLSLREAINSVDFQTVREESNLVIPLGIVADGGMEILNLLKQPNLLVAGAVMSGKTEFLNCVIASLALCYQPDDVLLLLYDVTRVEFTSFNGLSHVVRPVSIYVEEAVEALHWLDNEVSARYERLAAANTINIEEYNRQNTSGKQIPHLVEKLSKQGEILYLVAGENRPKCLQGFYISDTEIDNLVSHRY